MTLDEFFEVLPKDGWEFALDIHGERVVVRRKACCPIVAASRALTNNFVADNRVAVSVGLSMGLAKPDCVAIIRAADNGPRWARGFSALLRQRLLEHCGLTENAA